MHVDQGGGRGKPQVTALDGVLERYLIRQGVRRTEDPRRFKGLGRYLDDVALPGQASGLGVVGIRLMFHLRSASGGKTKGGTQ